MSETTQTSIDRRAGGPRNLAEEVVRRLTEQIRGGSLKPGDRLPTERDLVEVFGVSRTVVREAIAALKAGGLVTTRQGSGAYVTDLSLKRLVSIDEDALRTVGDALRLLELRLAIEVEAAGLAARHATAPQLARMQELLEEIDALAAAGEPTITPEIAFHQEISAASGNPYFGDILMFLSRVSTVMIPRLRLRMGLATQQAVLRYMKEMQGEHWDLYRAIAARDEAAARLAMRAHLEASRAQYESIAATTGEQEPL